MRGEGSDEMKWVSRVTTLLDIQFPIVQGGLAYLAYSELAAAVSNAGGLGQITAMSLESPEVLRTEIQKTRRLTTNPFGVNFAIGQHNDTYPAYLDVAIKEQVPVISITGGNPAPLFEQLEKRNSTAKKLVLVAAKKQALKAEQLGADAVIVVGQEGGGHLGRQDVGTFVLIPQVVDAVKIPVIASGGIADGRGLMAAFALGAEGIEMGTRFIAVQECVHATEVYKQALLAGTENDTVVIKRTLGAPARAIKNKWTDKILNLEKNGADFAALQPYINRDANKRYIYDGNVNEGFAWAGQAMGLIQDIPTVQGLMTRIIKEAESIQKKWI